ncbi:hypothetical protein Dimus_027876 [Dionaea muscipula]
MANIENKLVELLKDAGDRLSQPPASLEELLNLLDEVELLLAKVGQPASPLVQQALLPSMKALVSDQLFQNPDTDVKIAVAACINEIMRITAPDAPYNDERMKDFFELTVASFNKLSAVSGRSYTKAVSIIDDVSKVRSCVMMLDLKCTALIIKMFEQFQENIRSDHPLAVFKAMEAIMTLIILESKDISLELLKVILFFVKKENQHASPTAWKLGCKLIESCAEKLKPYLVTAINSMDISTDDYGPVVASIWEHPFHASERNHAYGWGEQMVVEHPKSNATSGEVGESGNEPMQVLSPQSKKYEPVASTKKKNPKSLAIGKQIEKPMRVDLKVKEEQGMGSRTILDEKSKKPSSRNPDEGCGKSSISKGKEQSLASPQVLPGKASVISNNLGETTPTSGGLIPCGGEDKQVHPLALRQDGDRMRKRAKRKEISEGSGEKKLPSKLKGHSSKKNENQEDQTTKTISRRKKNLAIDEVFETPHGKKYYKEDLIGCWVKVWWPKDKTYYEGVVTEFDAWKMKHRIEYDDGDEEVLNLRKEIWEMIGDDDEAHPLYNISSKPCRETIKLGAIDKTEIS